MPKLFNISNSGSLGGVRATTDASLSTIATITVPANTVVMISARVFAHRTGGSAGTAQDAAAYELKGVYKNVSGLAVEVGQSSVFSAEDQQAWTCSFSASAGTVLLQVQGAANNNISWSADYNLYSVST